ncbi:hypothetical protein Tco_0168675 [Tanacetum coccineum]
MQKESVSKQGRKTAKSKPTAHNDQAFDDFNAMGYMETDAYNEKGVSTKDKVSTDKPEVSTDKPKVSVDQLNISTDKLDKGTAKPRDGNSEESATQTAPTITSTPTPTVFGDDETIAEFLVSMSQNKAKQKGVEIKDAEDSDRPRPTSTRSVLTLKPLPKIDPKDKGKKVLEEEAESEAESEGVNEAERKFAKLANDEEIARKVQEEWETKEEKKKLAEAEATKAALIRDYDDIQARIEADSILAARLQEEEREKFTIEERAKLLHDTIAAQRRFLAQQRAAKMRSRPPTRMSDENFIAIGSADDERIIKDVNKKATDTKKDDSIKEERKEEETPDEDKEVDYKILDKKYPIIKWKSEHLGIKPRYKDEIPEGFDRVLWGDLMIMFNPSDKDEFWNSQQDWNVVSWKLHGSSGVHTLMTGEGLVIHMLVEKQYPLRKKVLVQMLELKLESEEDNTMALELIRFVKKLIAELEPENSDGNEKDL